ncbi:hypothetical protein C8Q77DRAFT_1204598 [Trametes polyzona]|nr:hypothetical protein C8Q77DRAFT_1204598 [Trametes polyzona]
MQALLLHHAPPTPAGDNASPGPSPSPGPGRALRRSGRIRASTSTDADADRNSDDSSDMERHPPGSGDGPGAGKQGAQRGQQQPRRGRSASQPVPQQPIAGPSRVPEIDFGFMQHQFGAGPGGIPQSPAGYEEDAIARALLAMQQQQQPQHQQSQHLPSQTQHGARHPPAGDPLQLPGLSQLPGGQSQIPPQLAGANPQLTDMFFAMLPYLQALQVQQQQQQHLHQQGQGPPHHLSSQQQQQQQQRAAQAQAQAQFSSHPHQQSHDPHGHQQHPLQHSPFGLHSQQLPPQRPPSQPQQQQQQQSFGFLPPSVPGAHQQDVQMGHGHTHSFVGGHFGTLPGPEQPMPGREGMMPPPPPPQPQPVSNTPSPEAAAHLDPAEVEAIVSAEDKRRRNTAASARFRIKKKQWTLNLERTISDLSGRVEELEREAAELRRENGWLKEIVMLKSKRFAGVVPDLEPPPSPSTASASGAGAGAGAGSGTEGAGSRAESRQGSRESSTEPTGRKRGGGDSAQDPKGKGKARQRSPHQ